MQFKSQSGRLVTQESRFNYTITLLFHGSLWMAALIYTRLKICLLSKSISNCRIEVRQGSHKLVWKICQADSPTVEPCDRSHGLAYSHQPNWDTELQWPALREWGDYLSMAHISAGLSLGHASRTTVPKKHYLRVMLQESLWLINSSMQSVISIV